MASAKVQVTTQSNWMMIALANKVCVTEAMIDLLHNDLGLTKNLNNLHKVFSVFKQRHYNSLKKVIKDHQWDIFCHVCSAQCSAPCPKQGVTKLENSDITALAIVYRNLKKLLPNMDAQTIVDFQNNYRQYVEDACENRNFVMHSSGKPMDGVVFDDRWNKVKDVLIGLKYSNMKLFNDLKMDSFKYLREQIIILEEACKEMDSKKCDVDEVNKTLQQLMTYLQNQIQLKADDQDLQAFERRLKALEANKEQNTHACIKKDRINVIASPVAVVFYCFLVAVIFSNTPSINSDLQQRLNRSSRILRRHYNQTIGKQNMKSVHSNHRLKKRFYVELSIESKTDTDQHTSNNDRSYHVMQQLNPKSKITIDQLIGTINENNIVLIQGAGGIGKSYTLETAALHWAEGKIWQEMDFVFLLEFRMLNLYQKKNYSLKESIEKLYPSVFRNLKYDELLQEVGDRIIFLMDGLDEFANFNKTLTEANTLSPCNDSSISSGFYSLIQPKCFPGHKLVITGRTSHCEQLRNSFKDLSIDSFNILGFSSIQVNEYIEHYFYSNNTKANGLKVIIKQSESLQLMSRVPAFLWSLCELHQETSSFGDIATMTPIFAWQLTIFLRQHLRQIDENISNHHPMDIFENPRVKELVLHLSEIAEMTLRRDEALISSSELDGRINIAQLETSGLLCRVKTLFGEKIQFNHMQMQEFLTAIHYISNSEGGYQQLLTSDSLSGAVSFYAGLSGACLQNSNSSEDLKTFVMTLRICVQKQDIIAFPDHVLIHQNKMFLESLFEFQNNLSPPIFGICEMKDINIMQQIYDEILKGGTIQTFAYELFIVSKDCVNVPKFYLLNEIVKEINSCDIRKFFGWDEYFQYCPLKENDLRLLLKHDLNKISDIFLSEKKTCSSAITTYSDIIKCRSLTEFGISVLNNFPYYPRKNDEIKQLKSMLLSTHNSLKRVASNLQDCDGNREKLQQFYNETVFYYEALRKASALEKKINITLTKKCQASVNHCSQLYLEQKETRYSTAQLVYFFKYFGHHYNGYITQLYLVETLTSEETNIIAPHICNISRLYLFNSGEYQLEMLRIITQEILNCPLGSLIDTLTIDYCLLDRTFEYNTTNEMSLKRIHNVNHFIVRIILNTNRGFKLLRNNILQHNHLPSYKLRHLRILTHTLTRQCCDYLTEILPFIEKITVKPFTGYFYPNHVVNYCKDVIGERLHNKLPSDSRFDNIHLENWALHKDSDWIMDE